MPVAQSRQHRALRGDVEETGERAARGGLAGLQPRIAQQALLHLAGTPVVVGLLVGTGRDAIPPGSAAVLVDEDHPVFLTLVRRAAGAGRDARRVEAVIADPWEVHDE